MTSSYTIVGFVNNMYKKYEFEDLDLAQQKYIELRHGICHQVYLLENDDEDTGTVLREYTAE